MIIKFETYLDTRELAEGVYQVLSDFICYAHTKTETFEITIKKGFITDFASVPRIPFAYLLFGGIGNYSAVLHDGLYSNSSLVKVIDFDSREEFKVTRAWADLAFLDGLLERGVSNFKAKTMYLAVRLKGRKYFQRVK